MEESTIKWSNQSKLKSLVVGKKVLYIATAHIDYLRIQQEIEILKTDSDKLYIIVSDKKSYIYRLVYVYIKSLFFIKKYDLVFIGFAPQLVLPFL